MRGPGVRPTLIGVLQLSRDASHTRRRDARLAIARQANEEGYALLETFEVTGYSAWDGPVYVVIDALAHQYDAHAFMVTGDVDEDRLEMIAESARMVVRHGDSSEE